MVQAANPHRWKGLDIYAVLVVLIGLAGLLTWIVPAGRYERTLLENGRETVVPGSYRVIESSPAGIREFLTAIPDGLQDAASVVFLVFLVGGSVGVLVRAGVVELGLRRLVACTGERIELLVPALHFALAAVAAVVGMPELSIAWLPIVQPLLMRLGASRTTGVAVALLPPTLGAAFGVTVPATVGVGHLLAELPMYSAAGFRLGAFLVVQTAAVLYVVRRAQREIRNSGIRAPIGTRSAPPESARLRAAGVVALALFVGFVILVLTLGLGFEEISGACIAMAVLVSVVAGRRVNRICADFNEAFREILVGALVCGLARGVAVMMTGGQVMDTVVHAVALLVASLPPALTAIGVLLGQTVFNFLVPSGSGQALITLPILIPVADLSGITRQIVVLATQWGDGITNVIFPTSGYFMATLVMGRVGLARWVRYYFPLFLVILGIAVGGLALAQAMRLGPF